MRLLKLGHGGDLSLTEDLAEVPRYAILSHTWGADRDEVTFDDIQHARARDKTGYAKLEFCARQATKDGVDHFWIDTCCIKKADHTELSEAITSMFRWYRDAVKCYVYLTDVSYQNRQVAGQTEHEWMESFRHSRWFTRGWTLQELLAPKNVEFFSHEGALLGSKMSLLRHISEVTGIPSTALDGTSLTYFSIEDRMRWAKNRQTKKPEDKAYCLSGILDVVLWPHYGEGEENAFKRLRREIGVLPAQIDSVIRQTYNNGRLRVERLSGGSLSLEFCFVNLGIVEHVHDSNNLDRDTSIDQTSKFSLAARLKVETPLLSHQVSLSTLFQPRERRDGTTFRPTRILIWGRAGMGKTTLCKKIVDQVINHSLWNDLYDRVIWLPLRRLKNIQVRDTIELLQHEFPITGLGERLGEVLRTLVQDDRTLFLLDGLDEVSFSLDRDSPGGRVLHDLVSRSHVIITSRPHRTHVLDHKTPNLELETVGFFPQQVEEYIQRVVTETQLTDQTAEEIRSFIQSRPLVQSLARIPIQLDAICYTWHTEDFSKNTVTMTYLYLMISQRLWKDTILRLGKKSDGDFITKQQLEHWLYFEDTVRQEIDFLQELAFRGLCEETIEFGVKDIIRTETGRQIPGDRFTHISFLRASDSSVETSGRTLHFIHLTFQEFFAAQYFVQHWISGEILPFSDAATRKLELSLPPEHMTPKNFVRSEKYIDRYDVFWRFVAGLLWAEPDSTPLYEFIRVLEDEPIDLIGRAHQRLVIHCLSEVGSDSERPDPHLQKLEENCLQWILYESKLRQEEQGLGHVQSLVWETECSDYVLERLITESDTTQEVLEALCNRSSISSRLLDMTFSLLGNGCSRTVQTLAFRVVGLFCGPGQSETFTKLWNNVRGTQADLLNIIVAWRKAPRLSEPATQALLSLLHSSEASIRVEVVITLGRQASLSYIVVEALVPLLLYDSEASVRKQVVITLGGQVSLPDIVIKALVSLLLNDLEASVLEETAFVLQGKVRLPNIIVKALVPLLSNSKRSVRREAAIALGEQASLPDTVVEALVSLLLHDSSNLVRKEVAFALGGQTNLLNVAVEALVSSLLYDSHASVRMGVASTIRRQASLSDAVIEALVSLLHNSKASIQIEAAFILKGRASLSNTAVEALVSLLLHHPEGSVREEAVFTLGGQENLPNKIVEAILPLLLDSEASVREEASFALRRQASLPEAAVEALVPLLCDSEASVRENAARGIKRQASLPDTAIEALVPLLYNSEASVRKEAARALERQASLPDTAIEALVSLLYDSEVTVREEAVFALRGQANLPKAAVEALVSLLYDSEASVRSGAVFTLGGQANLSEAAVEALMSLLQQSEVSVRPEAMRIAAECEQILRVLPTFESVTLQQFVRWWSRSDSAICFIWGSHVFIRSSGVSLRISLQKHQLKSFKSQWLKARNKLGLPSLSPCSSAITTSDSCF